ncbi:MAG: hypothetical protein ABI123_09960 [Ginsengibacter sp.]|jgi:hypothetical protein
MKNKTSISEQKFVEPPELREAGVPPLRKQISYITIAVAIIVLVVLVFAIYFIMQ